MANGRLRCLGSAQHLKNKFGQGFQIEMKADVTHGNDEDYQSNARVLAASKLGITGDIEAVDPVQENMLLNVDQAKVALQKLTGDASLADMLNNNNSYGYRVYKDAMLVGVTLNDLAVFATDELRIAKIESFFVENFPKHILRERQDLKVRYEVSSEGIRISSLFACIEENKVDLKLADYGVSQTSLEQVFNMHAAEAEKLKQGRDDR
jgi:ATP-binding cassette, subfamily A (ABC1), member 3